MLLEHDAPDGRHWDFMIEMPGASKLTSWRLAANPLAGGDGPIAVEPIGNHRREYLDYEGEISRGRGSVRRLDRGECRVIEEAYRHLDVELAGQHLRGRYRISRLASTDGFRRRISPRPADH